MFMRIKIYQIDRSRDERRLRFCDYQAAQAKGGVRASEYSNLFAEPEEILDEEVQATLGFPFFTMT